MAHASEGDASVPAAVAPAAMPHTIERRGGSSCSRKRSNRRKMEDSFSESAELNVDFGDLDVLRMIFEAEPSSATESSFLDILEAKDNSGLRDEAECKICCDSLHRRDMVTLRCGHVLHARCFYQTEKNECPFCRDTGPHLYPDRDTVITKALGLFETKGWIPPVNLAKLNSAILPPGWANNYKSWVTYEEMLNRATKAVIYGFELIANFALKAVKRDSDWRTRKFKTRSQFYAATPATRALVVHKLAALANGARAGLPFTDVDRITPEAQPAVGFSSGLGDLEKILEMLMGDLDAKLKAKAKINNAGAIRSAWRTRVVVLRDIAKSLTTEVVAQPSLWLHFHSLTAQIPVIVDSGESIYALTSRMQELDEKVRRLEAVVKRLSH